MRRTRTLAVLTSEPEGPVVRHRWTAFGDALLGEGVRLETVAWPKGWRGRAEALRRVETADGVVVSSRLLTRRSLRRLRARARRMAFDFDDALPYRDSAHGATRSATRWRRFRALVRASDLVIAGNPYLAGLAARAGRSATVVPTVVDVPPGGPPPEPQGRPPVLGWIGSRSTLRYLEERLLVFSALVASGNTIRLLVVADAAPCLPPGIAVHLVPWTSAGWRDALAAMHVGVAPLPDDPWTRGKCGLKVLQMLSVGRPVVCSAVGVQEEQVRHGQTGLVAHGREEFLEHLLRLLDDPALRRRMGAQAIDDVRERWSVARWAPTVVREVERLLS